MGKVKAKLIKKGKYVPPKLPACEICGAPLSKRCRITCGAPACIKESRRRYSAALHRRSQYESSKDPYAGCRFVNVLTITKMPGHKIEKLFNAMGRNRVLLWRTADVEISDEDMSTRYYCVAPQGLDYGRKRRRRPTSDTIFDADEAGVLADNDEGNL